MWGTVSGEVAMQVAKERRGGVVLSASPPSSLAKALHTQPFEVSSPDTADAVEAGVEVGSCLGKTRDAL